MTVELLYGLLAAPTPTPQPPPELWGMPVAILAFILSLFSVLLACFLAWWQLRKHFLDGGRVKVFLNVAAWTPPRSGDRSEGLFRRWDGVFRLNDPRWPVSEQAASRVKNGYSLEIAQLVVENPGKVPVTIYDPSLWFSGHGRPGLGRRKRHFASTRMYEAAGVHGANRAITDIEYRLEPYARVTFMLDYWPLVREVLAESKRGRVHVRGYVAVAGKPSKPQLSKRKLRWKLKKDTYTSVAGSPKITPIAVLWGALWRRLPESAESREAIKFDEAKDAVETVESLPITRDRIRRLLDEAMSQYESRPEAKKLGETLEELAEKHGDYESMLSIQIFDAYEELDALEGHLGGWTDALKSYARKQRAKEAAGQRHDELSGEASNR